MFGMQQMGLQQIGMIAGILLLLAGVAMYLYRKYGKKEGFDFGGDYSKDAIKKMSQSELNSTFKGMSDVTLKELDLKVDRTTGDIVTEKEYEKREKKRKKNEKDGKDTKNLDEGDKYKGCVPPKVGKWQSNGTLKCCDKDGKNCVDAVERVVGERCKGMHKPNCAEGYKVNCKMSGIEGYAYRCCKKVDGEEVCDSSTDSRVQKGERRDVLTRTDDGKCPPGTDKDGGKCMIYNNADYTAWFNEWYVPKVGGKCPDGTTSNYKLKDGSKSGSRCFVTDQSKYRNSGGGNGGGGNSSGNGGGAKGVVSESGWNQESEQSYRRILSEGMGRSDVNGFSDCQHTTRMQTDKKGGGTIWVCPPGFLDTGISWDFSTDARVNNMHCVLSDSCRKKVQDFWKKHPKPAGQKGNALGPRQQTAKPLNWNKIWQQVLPTRGDVDSKFNDCKFMPRILTSKQGWKCAYGLFDTTADTQMFGSDDPADKLQCTPQNNCVNVMKDYIQQKRELNANIYNSKMGPSSVAN